MNSLEAAIAKGRRRHRARAVMAGRGRSGRRRPVHLLVDCKPDPAPLHFMFQLSRLASPKIRNLRPLPRPALAQPRSIQRIIQHMNRTIIQFLNRARWPWYTKPLINLAS
jgi:hypothetical protein